MFVDLKKNKIILIGGGKLLLKTAEFFEKRRYDIRVILSVRHSKEKIKKKTFKSILEKKNINFDVVRNINKDKKFLRYIKKNKDLLVLCIGPSWIINNEILKYLKNRIFNINCIPLPKYLGGAHFTWQILNNCLDCGIYLQKITNKIDKGAVVLGQKFKLNIKHPKPIDYFKVYETKINKFLIHLLNIFTKSKNLKTKLYKSFFINREYYPRLNTNLNGMIDWSIETDEIIRFSRAFDEPYMGSSSFIKGKKIYLKNAKLFKKFSFHPFTFGLILKKEGKKIFVATKGGLIRFDYLNDKIKSINKFVKQGERFFTPHDKLVYSKIYRPTYK